MAPRGIPIPRTTATRPINSPPIVLSFFLRARRSTVGTAVCVSYARQERKVPSESASWGVRGSVYFVDLEVLVDGEYRVADGGAGAGGSMAGGGGEIGAGARNGVGVAVAFGALHGDGVGGDEFVE